MSRRSKACEFSAGERKKIKARDEGQCIFCKMFGYSGYEATQIMHYIPRSHGGLGVEKNGALGCVVHHQMLDNSDKRKVMQDLFKSYLYGCYDDWTEKDLIYSKWAWTEE